MNVWEEQYRQMGFRSQRLYPNEELLRFMGGNYFGLSREKRKKIKILEVGSGSGANLWMLAKEGFKTFGIDSSKTALKLCKKMLKHWQTKADIRCSGLLELPFPNNSFDAVVDVVTLQHITYTDHFKAFAEINRVLKTGGKFFSFHQGSKSHIYKHGGGIIIDKFTIDNVRDKNLPLNNVGVYCFPNENEFENILKRTGFTNINIENVVKTYDNRKIKIQYLVVRAQKK